MLVVGFALLFSAGRDTSRAYQIDADFIPNVHLDFGPQILKRDVHTVILSELFPLGFPPGRVSTASLSQKPSRRGPLPVQMDRPRGTLDAKKHPDGLIEVPSVHLDGKGWRLHWKKRGRGLPQACMAFHGGVRLGFLRVVPVKYGPKQNRKTPFRGTKRGLVRGGCGMARRAARLYLFIPLIVGDGDGRTPWHAITCLIHALPLQLVHAPIATAGTCSAEAYCQGASNLPIIRTE